MSQLPTSMRFYHYKVESLDIIFPSEGKHYPIEKGFIKSIMVERDYENDFFPVIRLDLSLDTAFYHKIIANKLDVKFRMRVQKYIYDTNNTLKVKKDVFNTIFSSFIDEGTPFLDKKEYEEANKVALLDKNGQNNTTIGGNDITFYLFKESDLINSKKIINTVITSANMTQTLTYLLSKSGLTGVLMVPLDNKNKYSEIIIPPLTVLGNLIYLDNQYGYYKNGTLIFFDIDCIYIIDRSGKCKAFRKGEYKKTVITVRNTINPHSLSPGSYDDSEKKTIYVNVDPRNVAVSNVAVIKDQTDGNNRLIINPAAGFTVNIKAKTVQRGAGTYKVLYNKYNNSFVNSSEQIKVESDNRVVNVTMSDIDIDAFTPNKEFTFVFEDSVINKQMGGNYRLVSSNFIFVKNGDYFKLNGTATFKK
jgi:hypothetical protein